MESFSDNGIVYMIQVYGEWAGRPADGKWWPAIAGTLNQTGSSDVIASCFATREEANEVMGEINPRNGRASFRVDTIDLDGSGNPVWPPSR